MTSLGHSHTDPVRSPSIAARRYTHCRLNEWQLRATSRQQWEIRQHTRM
jgi:hypothetical protein